MSWHDEYYSRMNAIGKDAKEYLSKNAKNSNIRSFKDSPFYKIIKINGVDIDVRFTSRSATTPTKPSQKFIAFLPDVKIPLGSIAEFNDERWLVIDFSDSDIFPLATIQLCNHTLKWQRNCKILSYPTVVFSRTAYKDDVYPDRTMTLASGQYQLYIQDTEETRALKIDDRFFIGRDVYEIAYIDEVTMAGILILTLNKSMKSGTRDRLDLGIADYVECDETNTPPIPDADYSIVVSGANSIITNQTLTYVAKVYENGNETTETIDYWTIVDVNGNPSTLASVVSVDGNSVRIKAGNVRGKFRLVAEDVDYGVIGYKEIEITGMW